MLVVKKSVSASGKVQVTGTKFLKATQTYPRQFCEEAAKQHRELLQGTDRKD